MAGTSDKHDPLSRPPGPFTASEMRDRWVRAEIEKERAALDAKTARLRALRLARDAEEAARIALEPKPVKAQKAPRKRKG